MIQIRCNNTGLNNNLEKIIDEVLKKTKDESSSNFF